LDAVIVPDHPCADPATGAAHACGHHAQIAGLLGAAMALADTGIMRHLAGNIALMAVPAEEYVQIEYRRHLMREGKIEFLGGKPEFIRLGLFDDVNMALMIHTGGGKGTRISATSNGCVAKQVQFIGKAAHAGGSPHTGINALNAATLALSAIHAQRETFREADTVRVHPIITKGGDAVNVVPADVRIESFVRAKTLEAILDADRKVDRALKAGAMAVGAQVELTTLPGYMPLMCNPLLNAVYKANVMPFVSEDTIEEGSHSTASTDMGDVTQIMPAIQPLLGGSTGAGHGADWMVDDPELAYLAPAKVLAMCAIDLLAGDAACARDIMEHSTPAMTKERYLECQRALLRTERFSFDS
jgi:amidohydrolase